MELSVNISQEQYSQIVKKVSEDIREEVGEEEIRKYLESDSLSITDLTDEMGLYDRVQNLKSKKVEDLTNNEKILLMMQWMIFDSLYR